MATIYDLTTQKVIGKIQLPTSYIYLLGSYSWAKCDEKIINIYKLNQLENKDCSLKQYDFLCKTYLKTIKLIN